MSTNYTSINNRHSNFPPLMNDGKLYTDWESACNNNNKLKKSIGINDNYEYRQWLINNANNVINQNRKSACLNSCSCTSTFEPIRDSNKYIFRNCDDKIKPHGYETSDLKTLYLNKEALQEKLTAPIMTQEQLIKNGVFKHF